MNRKPSPMKLARLARGLYLKDAAASLGVSHQAVSLWEQEKRTPDPLTTKRLAKLYGVPVRNLGVARRNGCR